MIKFKKLISIILVLAVLFSVAACGESEKDNGEVTSVVSEVTSAEVSSEEEEIKPVYFDTDIWKAVPLVTKEMLDRGISGGEGCQAVLYVTFAPDGKTVLMGTDVGGIYKSTDAGDSWYPCSIGMESAGGTGMAFDPKNQERVICIGSNSGVHHGNGVYLSTDTGETWEYVYKSDAKNYRNAKNQVAFDETSYDETLKGCMTIYWSREKVNDDDARSLIYRSDSGGTKWEILYDSGKYANGYIFVNAKTGAVATGNSNGVHISDDKGETFNTVIEHEVLALDYVNTRPNNLYATILNKTTNRYQLAISTNFGRHWNYIDLNMAFPCYLRVSPVNPDRMVLMDDTISKSGQYPGYVYSTVDGGMNWTRANRDSTNSSVPANSDNVKFAWSPTNEKTVLASWCFMTKSTDGGVNFKWSNNGYNGICPGDKTNFNVNNSDYIYYASQDYNGAFSTDGGVSWKYMKWDGKGWGGWTYGGYVINKNTVVTGVADQMFGPIKLWITYDGGNTFQSLGIDIYGSRIGCGVIGSDKIAFFGEYRTEDGGYTWERMRNCAGVYTVDYSGSGALFGKNGSDIVVSTDTGKTWTTILSAHGLSDLAYNYKTHELFVCSGTDKNSLNYNVYSVQLDENFKANGNLKLVDIGYNGTNNVCVDPNNPDIMYAGCNSDSLFNVKSTWRSLDAGKTWTCLTRYKGDGRTGPDGGKKVVCMRVNAKTSELFVFSGCRGVWKIAPPPNEYYT